MGIQGTGLKDKNIRLRFLMIFFGGIIAFGAIFYWRQQTLKQADYVDFPTHKGNTASAELRSKNYQLDIEDASPSVK